MSIQLPASMAQALDSFVMMKLRQYGRLPSIHDMRALRDAITIRLQSPSPPHMPAILAKEAAQIGVAETISQALLTHGLNRAPIDRGIVSFAECVVDFYHGICSDYFIRGTTANILSRFMGNNAISSQNPSTIQPTIQPTVQPTVQQNPTFPIFILPAELRLMVYREAMVVYNRPVRSFAPPALLQANRLLRDEASPVFYGKNHFEITIKRSREIRAIAAGKPDEWVPSLDMWMWHQFLHMWDVFNGNGSNCLQHVKHITLIYQLGLTTGWPFGEDHFDKRVGFRFSSEPFVEDLDGSCTAGSTSVEVGTPVDGGGLESGSAGSEDALGLNFDGLQAGADTPEADGSDEESSIGDEGGDDGGNAPEGNIDEVDVFELNRGNFDWPSRTQTHSFLFHRLMDHDVDHLWDIYPIHRFTHMLWCCVKNCHQASRNVDFICEDAYYWTHDNDPYTHYDVDGFYDPDNQDMDENDDQ